MRTVSPNGGLIFDSDVSLQTVNNQGNGTAVTPMPDPGYQFVNWSDGSTANPRTDTNVTTNISVTANFAINTYTPNRAGPTAQFMSPPRRRSIMAGPGLR